MPAETPENQPDVDVVVVGAGFAGLYLLHRLRGLDLTAMVFETGDDVGGTWYWNRYPGARCDVQSIDYSYSFDPELEEEWQWTEKYATQPEILRYLDHVAEKFDLRRDIQFSTKVASAAWDDDASLWRITTDAGDEVSCRYYVMATGCLSAPKDLDIEGVDRFRGEVYFTSRWPHDGVDLDGKRVAVIGTGSSGIQSIPIMAEQAGAMTVFQRTPNFSIPAHNGPIPADKLAATEGRYQDYREEARWSRGGVPAPIAEESALQVSEEERQSRYEVVWDKGELFAILGAFNDLLFNESANETLAEFIRNKIRSIVDDPETAEALCPTDHPFGTKRPCLDTGYYETYNLPHVDLVDLRKSPITTITETGIETEGGSYEFDVIVFATGFDAMTGAIVAVDISGRDGLALADKWQDGPKTYLGLTVAGFPNLFAITGPGSPSVLSNMVVSIEQHVDWVCDCIDYLRSNGLHVIEATEESEAGWVQHVNDAGDLTLYPKANSWYMGSNVPGKPRVFLPFVGGVDAYRQACNEVAEQDYLGFRLSSDDETRENRGIIRPLQPDVTMVLSMMAELGLPPLESMSPEEARAFSDATNEQRPPGPDVGEIIDGVLPGAAGDLNYRLYRPPTEGPHPVVAYYHGGGWVLGSHDSDDPFCRDLCLRSDALIVSADYRHAPEHRFPAAADDAYAALQWIADNAEALGGIPGQLAIAGWSAGANVAAVAAQRARDTGGPSLSGQLLVTPVTDCDVTRPSYTENADGYILTTDLMRWFWDHYADPEDRTDPRVSPIRADDLSNLPPTVVITCEFDPLRDEGAAYAEALADAGVDVRHLNYRGHIHTSLTAVDMILSGAPARADMADALRQFFGASVPA
ncbi:MAG: alpha/beta hydrolase fold domain-containing protein [Acidimicrobiia bacterium]|nr:alpha/beta hydrolase fold domain-containing protein [Acidimicrobiia bacterium]